MLGRFSLLTLDGDDHMRQRKLLLPPFHGEAVRRYRDLIAEIAAREVERWPVGEPFALRPRMQAITLEVILRAVFGVREEERLARFRTLLPRLGEATGRADVAAVPAPRPRPVEPVGAVPANCAREVDELVYDEIRRRRAEPDAAERDDVLSLLLGARHEDGSPMSDRELRDELITLLTAGHETSATGARVGLRAAAAQPRARCDRCSAEVEAGGDEYADAVVKETLRVRPVIVDVARLVTSDVELGAWTVPRGHDRRAGDRARAADAATCIRTRTSSGPSASSTASPRRTRGSRSAAACGAASARRSRSSRSGRCCRPCVAQRARCARPTRLRSASACAT